MTGAGERTGLVPRLGRRSPGSPLATAPAARSTHDADGSHVRQLTRQTRCTTRTRLAARRPTHHVHPVGRRYARRPVGHERRRQRRRAADQHAGDRDFPGLAAAPDHVLPAGSAVGTSGGIRTARLLISRSCRRPRLQHCRRLQHDAAFAHSDAPERPERTLDRESAAIACQEQRAARGGRCCSCGKRQRDPHYRVPCN